MDYVLRKNLPIELVEIIALKVHKMNMEKVLWQIKHCVVWVRVNNKTTFWVSNNTNYYKILDTEWEVWVKSKSKNDRLDMWIDLFDG